MEPDLLRDGRPAERARADGRLALEAAADVAAGQEDDVALKTGMFMNYSGSEDRGYTTHVPCTGPEIITCYGLRESE